MKNTSLIATRVKRGLIQRQVAKRIRVDASRLSLIENGHVDATDDEIKALCSVLGASREELGFSQQPSEVAR